MWGIAEYEPPFWGEKGIECEGVGEEEARSYSALETEDSFFTQHGDFQVKAHAGTDMFPTGIRISARTNRTDSSLRRNRVFGPPALCHEEWARMASPKRQRSQGSRSDGGETRDNYTVGRVSKNKVVVTVDVRSDVAADS